MNYLKKNFTLYYILLAISLFASNASAQQKHAFSGFVKSNSGISLIGAGLKLSPGNWSAVTDGEGHFQFNAIPAGKYKLQVKYMGFVARNYSIDVPNISNKPLNCILEEDKKRPLRSSCVG